MEDQEVSIIELHQPEKLSIFQQEKAAIDVQIATAKAYPRNVRRSVENAITIATMDEDTAGSCSYALPRGKKTLEGPSIHLAKIIAQSWGNLRMGCRIVDIDLKHVTSQGICWDLENNIAIQAEVKRLIIGREGRFSDDMITVTANAANAVSLRNAIFDIIPRSVLKAVSTAADRKLTGKLTTEDEIIKKRIELLTTFRELYGVTEQEILYAIGKQAVDHIRDKEIVILVKLKTALRDGDTTVDETFRGKRIQTKSSESSKIDRIIALFKHAKTISELEKHKGLASSPELIRIYDECYADLIKQK